MIINDCRIYRYAAMLTATLIVQGCTKDESPIPSDAYLTNVFYANFADYQLVKAEMASHGIYRVTLRDDEIFVKPDQPIDDAAIRALHEALANRLQIDLVDTRIKKGTFDQIEQILFVHYSDGFVFGGQAKGIAFLAVDPNPAQVVANLDKYREEFIKQDSTLHESTVYERLNEEWYLYYSYSD
jgi:hypothetical protein